MTDVNNDLKLVRIDVTKKELRYFISCGFALVQNVPEESLPTYCGLNKDEVVAISLRLRQLADQLNIDM